MKFTLLLFLALSFMFGSTVLAQRCGFDFAAGVMVHPFDAKDSMETIRDLLILVSPRPLSSDSDWHSSYMAIQRGKLVWNTNNIDTDRSISLCYQNDTAEVADRDDFKYSDMEYNPHWRGNPHREHFTVGQAKDNYLTVFSDLWKFNYKKIYVTIIDTLLDRLGGYYERKTIPIMTDSVFSYCEIYGSRDRIPQLNIELKHIKNSLINRLRPQYHIERNDNNATKDKRIDH
jgi:hypothetical protein